ncbi:MAG: hypothetical protein LBU70_03940 [Chitinispirillales bacterium]|jgi:tetratricopeptide (TPR) repeat protein|nr:hypothetical protein [Chitinispirillales bacterium]
MSTPDVIDNITEPTLAELCDAVLSCRAAYDDVAEQVEDIVYFEYGHGGMDDAIHQLERLTRFFEGMQNKNEEVCRDLAQIYLLIGQIYQYAGNFENSIDWIKKSIVVDDMYPVAYHSLAISFQSLGDESLSIKSLEQEITVEPGNYYTYLLLADLYEKSGRFDMFDGVIRRLLERDPGNIQGMHKMIRFCERDPDGRADVELLRRRLLKRADGLNRIDAVIRAYHLAQAGRYGEAIEFLDDWIKKSPNVSITHLAGAHIYGLMRQYSKMRDEVARYKNKNHGHEDAMEIKINEFATVFGEAAAEKIRRLLKVVYPGVV